MHRHPLSFIVLAAAAALTWEMPEAALGEETPARLTADGPLPTADGFRGIWYYNQKTGDEYVYKYSGGLATYPQQHHPIAIYQPEANKTFFVYGGTPADANRLLHMVSYYDHATGQLARPRILLDKQTDDAHDNPTLAIDREGYLWIFSNAHGVGRPAYLHRSSRPYDITAFDHVQTTNFSYSQPWHLGEHGFVFLHTLYDNGRRFLHVSRSDDGRTWSEPQRLANVALGHYQVSWPHGERLGTAFNYHPRPIGLNGRTNLYYMETRDGGRTWQNIEGDTLTLPLAEPDNPALVLELESKGQLAYLKGLQYTPEGQPVILYVTTQGFEPGPGNDPRTLTTARWTGDAWEFRPVTTVDHNYDFASLYIEPDGWRLIGETTPGPQAYNNGGEMALWTSTDEGATWKLSRQMTHDSPYNHSYARQPLAAQPDFYALWADGHARQPSQSHLYFCTRDGDVYRMPAKIAEDAEFVSPERLRTE